MNRKICVQKEMIFAEKLIRVKMLHCTCSFMAQWDDLCTITHYDHWSWVHTATLWSFSVTVWINRVNCPSCVPSLWCLFIVLFSLSISLQRAAWFITVTVWSEPLSSGLYCAQRCAKRERRLIVSSYTYVYMYSLFLLLTFMLSSE